MYAQWYQQSRYLGIIEELDAHRFKYNARSKLFSEQMFNDYVSKKLPPTMHKI